MNPPNFSTVSLQLYWIPIRDWNTNLRSKSRYDVRLQLYWIPIRDWNEAKSARWQPGQMLQLYWIPIRDWNLSRGTFTPCGHSLQLYWIPIRDWNLILNPEKTKAFSCNYIESLLGIETSADTPWEFAEILGCNYIESLLGIETFPALQLEQHRSRVATILNPY